MTIQDYLDNVNALFITGKATEHSYRGDLQKLLVNLTDGIKVINEPKRIECGAPDYVLTRKDIPIGFIEAKNIADKDLHGKKKSVNKNQFDRYKASLDNLIFTDYLDFLLYIDGEYITSIKLAEIQDGKIVPLPQNFDQFTNLIQDFVVHVGQTIKSSTKLSKMMAGKAKMLAEVIEKAVVSDEESNQNSTIKDQMNAFKEILIHDIKPKEFADIYAQTIAYGMFAARLHDDTLEDFSRQEAASLIPKSNPFLRKLFQYISGYDIDKRIEWIVAALADIFRATDVHAILTNFGKATQMNDPIIHFYENFLAEYDPKLRKARGVWYTPEPVVNFIVRAVDDILKTEFGLPQGLADNSKTKIKVNTQNPDKRSATGYKQVEKEVHRVQILDPATGTGTFLAEVVKHIYNNRFKAMQGAWSGYVENDLIPRLNGFELLMASYAMAHLKMDMLLTETGYKAKKEQRFKIYLTNSLEESHPDTGTLFASWLSSEANEANVIKRDTPVMCVIGNPPYSGESANKGDWIMNLMQDYKKEPGGKEKLKEKNSKWINDDYVKFLRYGQHFINKNGEGVLAFINPHGFIDNPTFRGMRWHLLKTYDKIYILDLHGNSNKKERCPDGSPDVNVFDIQQGVSVNIFIKTGKKKANTLAKVFHFDVYGKRELKYDFLWKNSLSSIDFKLISNKEPLYFMAQKDFEVQKKYDQFIKLTELLPLRGAGMVTKRDAVAYQFSKEKSKEVVTDIFELSNEEIKAKYNNVSWESRDGKVEYCKNNVVEFGVKDELFVQCNYKPFDYRWTYYTGVSKGFIGWPVNQIMKHFLQGDNYGIASSRQCSTDWKHIFISTVIGEFNLTGNAGRNGSSYYFPLYLYPDTNQATLDGNPQRRPNLDPKIVAEIADKLGMTFTPEKETTDGTFAPIDILDYIYAVLHSPAYREKYKEFLKIDFPRVPYPKDTATFWKLVALGKQIREIHLLESPTVEQYITGYPMDGDNIITRKLTKTSIGYEPTSDTLGRVWINDEQYFENVPLVAWEFYIGGYQPAQKWLKDRKGRELSFDDILHYQKVIVALTETDRLMQEVDKVGVE